MSEFIYTNNIPDTLGSDVVVVGGGPAGLCAAVAAARGGAKVLLVEKNAFCGGMATAGMGDVLSGIIGALLARKILPDNAIADNSVQSPLHRTAIAAYIHGLAGDIAADEYGEYSLTASDVVNSLYKVIKPQ